MMFDSGAGLNTIPEEALVAIINACEAAGIRMSDPRHPVVELQSWAMQETCKGVAGGVAVPLIGAVILAMTFIDRNTSRAQAVSARFGGLSPGGLMAIHLGLPRCKLCGNVPRGLDMVRCGHCGATLCGGTCAAFCQRTGLRFVCGCTQRFCHQCEPVHVCARGASCGVSCRYPRCGLGKRSELIQGRLGRVGKCTGRCNSSPPGGGWAPPRPVDYDSEDWVPVCM